MGLSCTAVGMRPIETCVDIFYKLQEDLTLNYLELAIGTHININNTFHMPVVIHDRALYVNESNKCVESKPRRIDYLNYRNDLDYIQEFCSVNKVLALSLHAPKKHSISLSAFDKRIKKIEEILNIPVYVETMYKDDEWYSNASSIGKSKLLIDVSHVNIWTNNNKTHTQDTVCSLLDTYDTGMIHLSDNNGKRDSHDLIKPDLWFDKYLEQWNNKYLITWESLPIKHRYYERLDKKSTFDKLGANFNELK